MTSSNQRLKTGDIVKHFKRGDVSSNCLKHCYVVLDDNVLYTDTDTRCVLYQALYGEHQKFCRSFEQFEGVVDKERYPEVAQEYRLELITDDELLALCKEVVKTLS